MPQRLTEITGPLLGEGRVAPSDHDLTGQHSGEPLGQRIVVAGRVSDEVADASHGQPRPPSNEKLSFATCGRESLLDKSN
jgi:hypothetical protein